MELKCAVCWQYQAVTIYAGYALCHVHYAKLAGNTALYDDHDVLMAAKALMREVDLKDKGVKHNGQ